MTINKKEIFRIIITSLSLVFAVIYYYIFQQPLESLSFESPYNYISSFVIPDTYLYLSVIDDHDPISSIFNSVVKNTIGPSLIWYVANGSWLIVIIINAIFLYWSCYYIFRLCELYNVNSELPILLIAMNPVTIFYMIGALKEIPTMLFILGFFYYIIKEKTIKWLVFSLLLIIFRYQLLIPLVIFIIMYFTNKNGMYKKSLYLIVLLCLAFPLINSLNVLSNSATEIFREEQLSNIGSTLGASIEHIRSNIYILSAIAIGIRILQSILEPLFYPFQYPLFMVDGVIGIYPLFSFLSFVLTSYFIFKFIYLLPINLRAKQATKNKQAIFALAFLFLIPVAGFSFIHHRYIYPIIPIIIIAVTVHKKQTQLNKYKISPLNVYRES
ncbi:hypothetical protein [Thiothrix unzii]|jgi:hypothetical protein|uniref:hypothetical protein n=1 Tax=Thiothrix unzii TaxID=111769 RepID=UPI002A37047C|nr:hypothetical protein [Thiothrix unzii]MDX9988226.1 hypothetical protein [Thiothrix unzii]